MQYLLTAPLIFLLFHSASIFGFTPTGNVLNYNHPINNITPKSKIDQIISLNATNPNNKKLGILSRAVKQYRNKNVLEYLRKNHIHITNRRPLRDVSFWFRAGHIYTSYKLNQASNIVKKRVFKKSYADKKNQTWSQVHETNSQRMIRLCLSLKGFYLKTGQFLGTRHDFMPPHYTRKLSRLHDDLPPLNEHETRKNIEKELNGTIEEYFSYLNLTHPVGCASIAQVHEGVLRKSGT